MQNIVDRLTDHLRSRLLDIAFSGDGSSYTTAERNQVLIRNNTIHEHKILRVNYTTYDIRRGADTIHTGTERSDIMLLSHEEGEHAHPYWYARVLAIYHVDVLLNNGKPGTFRRIDLVLVRWFGRDDPQDHGNSLLRIGWDEENEYEFLDPQHILRACQVVPAYAHGLAPVRRAIRDSREDYNYYYVMRSVFYPHFLLNLTSISAGLTATCSCGSTVVVLATECC